MSQSFKLFRLQQIDSKLDKGQARLTEIDHLLTDDHQVRISQQRLENAKKIHYEAEKNLRLAEQKVQEMRLKIERSQAMLYGGKISNPKELQDLQQESESLKKYLNTLEDQQLEAMLALDDAEAGYLKASEDLASVKARVAEQNAELSIEKTKLMQDIRRDEQERQATTANIHSSDLQTYETLRQQKNGIAVARVLEKTCNACGSTLTTSTYSSAQVPTKITLCSNCGRILYVG